MIDIIVFYAGQVLLKFDNNKEFEIWRRSIAVGNREIYNGSYVYLRSTAKLNNRPWYRMNGTPVLLEDVPKDLRAQVLVLYY